MTSLILSLVALGWAVCSPQGLAPFPIERTTRSEAEERRRSYDGDEKEAFVYEDEQYLVTSVCAGEWGGVVRFRDKKTDVERGCRATCPVMVTRLGGKYYVTNSLSHMIGSCSVLEIPQPNILPAYNSSSRREKNTPFPAAPAAPLPDGAVTRLADSVGAILLASFPARGRLFHVMSDYQSVAIVSTEEGRFVAVQTLPGVRPVNKDRMPFITAEGHVGLVCTIDGRRGRLYLAEDRIILFQHR